MKPLRERDQVKVGMVSLLVLCLMITVAFFSKDLPVIGSGSSYSARFTESAGLSTGDEVHVAGVKVGEVTDVALEGDRVRADFRVDDARLGDRTSASIQIKTLLGEKFVALQPEGRGELESGATIPDSRTEVPFDIPDAIDQLTRTTEKVDTEQLAQSFRVMSDTFRNSPEHLDKAVDGISDLSRTIASRDQQLADLLHNTSDVSKVVADRNNEVRRLISDGNLLLSELQKRRESISSLLRGTERLSAELHGMIAENQQQLNPALKRLDEVTGMLQRNQENVRRTVASMAPYVRGFNNTVGNGRWFDGYLCNLFPPGINAGPLQTNTKGCEVPAPPPGESAPPRESASSGESPSSGKSPSSGEPAAPAEPQRSGQ